MYVDKKNEKFIDSIKQARYPERRETSQSTAPVLKPVHDWTADYRSALEYFAVNTTFGKSPPKRVNYLKTKHKVKIDENGKIDADTEKVEKKKRIIRFSFRSYN